MFLPQGAYHVAYGWRGRPGEARSTYSLRQPHRVSAVIHAFNKPITRWIEERRAGPLAQRRNSRTTERLYRGDQHDIVSEPEFNELRRHLRPAFAEDAGDPARGKGVERLVQIDMALGVEADALDCDAEIAEPGRRLLRRLRPGDDERRKFVRAGRHARPQRQAQMGVEHDAPWLAVESGQADGQRGVVGERRLDADHDRLVGRAHDLDAKIRDLPGDPQSRIVRSPRRVAVRSLGELQRHARPPGRDPHYMAAMIAPRLRGTRPDGHHDPLGPQPGMALPRHTRVRVVHWRDHARDCRLDYRVRAGRRSSEMRAGLERHVERRPPRRFAGLSDRDPLRMRPSA